MVWAPGKLADAEAEVGKSKIRKGRWVGYETECPPQIDQLYSRIVETLRLKADGRGQAVLTPSQAEGTVLA